MFFLINHFSHSPGKARTTNRYSCVRSALTAPHASRNYLGVGIPVLCLRAEEVRNNMRDFISHSTEYSHAFNLSQTHMGAVPIITSAKLQQGRCNSNHGGN